MTIKKILITGNEVIAEAAIQAGCLFYAGYPITPQNELIAYMAKRMPEENRIFIQAESEISAINMVLGAAASGFRAMTSSSSPGISLKQEGISYLAGCELPAVIINIMRGGPGLGNIAAAQSDYFQATRGGGHGDYHSIVLAPSTVQEAADLTFLAFDLADRYRNTAVILGDGVLGQMMEPTVIKHPSRAKTKNVKKTWALTGARNRSPNIIRSLYLKEGKLEEINLGLQAKYNRMKKEVNLFDGLYIEDSQIILVAYGTMARIAKSVAKRLRGQGKKIGLIRPLTLWPFPEDIFKRITARRPRTRFLVVEMSYGQMLEDVRLAVNGRAAVEFLGRAGGGIPTEEEIIKKVRSLKHKA